ncbi:SIMPL domain-containing protein [Cognatilysobacter bugurensis]|uniref:SIMPL domain-containing protein n=1 Tax=Cognatilysobacter bugurensis TaxID=543356 RepID=A0A918SXL8_9GAMM|nr:SIMPL domain-containing protein [Lysobacter bugurensis]
MPRSTLALSRFTLALALGAAAMSTVHAQAPAGAASHTASAQGTLLSVSAQAEARRTPDLATVSAGVVTEAADANAAMRANAERMQQVVDAIRKAGIEPRDVQTGGITLNPQYRYAENAPPAITGYQASNTVNVTVRELARLGKILDALVATGANQIHGPTFDIADREPALDEARRNALKQARARADMYAQSLGLQVRRIVSISEGARIDMPGPMPMAGMRMEKAMADTPVAPGENVLTANLDVVFELGQ